LGVFLKNVFLRIMFAVPLLGTISFPIRAQEEVLVASQEVSHDDIVVNNGGAETLATAQSWYDSPYSWLQSHLRESWLNKIKSGELPTPIHHLFASFLIEIIAYKNLINYAAPEPLLIQQLKDCRLTTGKVLPQSIKVDKILSGIGLDPSKVKVLEGTDNLKVSMSGACAVGSSLIVVHPSYLQESVQDETGDIASFLLGHEAGHLKQNVIIKLGIIALLAPFVSHYGLTWYDKGVQHLIEALEKKAGLKEGTVAYRLLEGAKKTHSYLATSWVAKASLSWYLYCLASRYYEKDADTRSAIVSGAPATLGGISFFELLRENNLKARWQHPLGERLISPEGNNCLDVLHPSLTDRIAYLKVLYNKQVLAQAA
jgi:Zn-dependent protease with chaperone function